MPKFPVKSRLRVTIRSSSLRPGVICQMQLSINNVSMRFGARILFEDVNTTFISGRRYAITGPNGAGKSTLMKIMTGEIDPDKGSVTRVKKMGVLKQDQFAFDAFRVMDTVIMGNLVLWEALQERELLYAKDPNARSEERRVGKECRSRWSPYH